MEVILARIVKVAFFLCCLAVAQVIVVLFLAGLTPESKSKFKAFVGNVIVLLPLFAVLPSWMIGVPPSPKLVLKELDLVLGVQIIWLAVGLLLGIYLRFVFLKDRFSSSS